MNIIKITLGSTFFLVLILAMHSCIPSASVEQISPTAGAPREIPTWTPRPGSAPETQQPTSTLSVFTQTPTITALLSPDFARVSIKAEGGNLHIRRGPGVDYNPISVLYAGKSAEAFGRDLVKRWVQIQLPSAPGKLGWVSALTEYSLITGNIEDLPVISSPPAVPAYIRNCTKNRMLVLPDEIELLGKYDEPYNEERFPPGEYQVYDLEAGDEKNYQTIILSEGSRVDILEDGLGEKSKCE